MPNILLIDDVEKSLNELQEALTKRLANKQLQVKIWLPEEKEMAAAGGGAREIFRKQLDAETLFVVTDYDLTKTGVTGLFGSTIVNWCKRELIPVGDYSRGSQKELPDEPDQYEIRIPHEPEAAAKYIANVFQAILWFREKIEEQWETVQKKRSPSGGLAQLLGRPLEESKFALYGVKLGAANSALMERMSDDDAKEIGEAEREVMLEEERKKLLSYVLVHLLLNVVLRFPGPLLKGEDLAAFLGIAPSALPEVEKLFQAARYTGPFAGLYDIYWLTDVSSILEGLKTPGVNLENLTSVGKMNREILEAHLHTKFARHDCERCQGEEGGFICPFTRRTTCQREDCSVTSNAWVPQGARLCRIEKGFYEEWAPLLGF